MDNTEIKLKTPMIYRGLPKIERVRAVEILDSRGDPTVRAWVTLADGSEGRGDAPAGASTGKYEAHERRDGGGKDGRYGGRGVLDAVASINDEIADALTHTDRRGVAGIDNVLTTMYGEITKDCLGANALLPVSIAYARACADHYGVELYEFLGGIRACGKKRFPTPMMNVLNGGAHASNNVDIQEFMIVPLGAGTMSEVVRIGSEVYHALARELKMRGLPTAVGDEGGFAPALDRDEDALDLLVGAVESSGHAGEVMLALDAAASEWASGETYRMPKRGVEMTAEELILYWRSLCEKYPVVSIEDGLGEDDRDGWRALTETMEGTMIVGDDLFVTNASRIAELTHDGIANAVLIKPNQTGTVTETFDAVDAARAAGCRVIVSHRSGETEDSFIADLAAAVGADFIKSGAPARSERTSKYNRLVEIYG